MNTKTFSWIVGACLGLGASAAWADKELEVGRLTAVFKEAGWKAGAEMPYSHELMSAQGTFRGAAKVFSLASADGEPLALMYVGVSYPDLHIYSQRGDCPNDARFYIRDLNTSKLEDRRCVMAGGPYTSDSLLNGGLYYLSGANKVAALSAPAQAYVVHAWATARGGKLIDVEVLLSPRFAGLANAKPVAEVPALVRPELAAWADTLAEAAIKGMTSFSGKLVVPPVEFSGAAK